MRRHDVGYFISEGLHGIVSHAFMSFAAVGIITACLLIMGSFSLVAVNLEYNLGLLMEENQFLAYVDEKLSEEEARALESEIRKIPNVADVTFTSREEAKEAYLAEVDYNELYTDLPDSVFRHRFAIHVVDITLLGDTIEQVQNMEGIANYSAALEVAQGLVTMRNISTAIALILVVVLLVISIFIISNTIRLATFTRRDEIAIMKMCGATNAFVRWPFVYEGIVLGLLGALVAFLLQCGLYGLIVETVSSATFGLIKMVAFRSIWLPILGIFAGTGLIVGVGGSVFTIRKFLQV